jgi:hypothetical protein
MCRLRFQPISNQEGLGWWSSSEELGFRPRCFSRPLPERLSHLLRKPCNEPWVFPSPSHAWLTLSIKTENQPTLLTHYCGQRWGCRKGKNNNGAQPAMHKGITNSPAKCLQRSGKSFADHLQRQGGELSFLSSCDSGLPIASCIFSFLSSRSAAWNFPGRKFVCICLTRHYFSRKQLSAQVFIFSRRPPGNCKVNCRAFLPPPLLGNRWSQLFSSTISSHYTIAKYILTTSPFLLTLPQLVATVVSNQLRWDESLLSGVCLHLARACSQSSNDVPRSCSVIDWKAGFHFGNHLRWNFCPIFDLIYYSVLFVLLLFCHN